ncbi:Chaperone surA [Gossypium australe]|uniref:Chaperone surA n=1 Tax=Gossypium australe TaxID=47621 RepID=A0A5B6VBP7_9ROSI|nr:Chaperone surA [Gossypium australe]
MDPDQTAADDAASNALAPAQGTAPMQSGPETRGQGEEAREAFLQIMSNWYRCSENNQAPIDKIQKYGAEKFRANIDDDPERAEFWLENSMRVFDELFCTPEESLKCTMSLLRDSA